MWRLQPSRISVQMPSLSALIRSLIAAESNLLFWRRAMQFPRAMGYVTMPRAEERRAWGIAAVSAARERATEIAQRPTKAPRLRPSVLHRRRLERLRGQA
jgi:hypothetical protein